MTMEPHRIGQRIAQRRRAFGWTQHTLAVRAGIPPATVSRYEIGRNIWLRLATLERLAAALGCSVSALLGTRDLMEE